MRAFFARLRRHALAIAIASTALGVVWAFARGVLVHNGRMGLPLEDSYIYLTYAKQFGRGQPFTYFPGGGYSAGATSVLWPMVIAPLWTLGARGHALVWVSYGLCAALYTATCVGAYRVARGLVPDHVGAAYREIAGALAAVLVLAIAPFAWTALSGMEVALAAALLVGVVLVWPTPDDRPPTRRVAVALAALSLSRPEAAILVALLIGSATVHRIRTRAYRAAAWWLAPIVPMLAWMTANRLLAGHWFPNTGVAKSHFYLPGFDWSYWWTAFLDQTWDVARGLCWRSTSPLPWPKLFTALWLVGAVRVIRWTWVDRRSLGVAIVAAPLLLILAVIASSGNWEFHNYRYIAPAFPPIAITAACALAPFRIPDRWPHAAWVRRAQAVIAVVVVAGFARASIPKLRTDIDFYAQNAVDLEQQVVAIGHYVHDKLPDARIMVHDAGAIAYYGDTPIVDMLGLVTNHQARIANHGPGARFEFLEDLTPDQRPTHFAYYRSWMGQDEMFGEVLLETRLRRGFSHLQTIGGTNMELIEADWDHVHTAERPLHPHPGWHVADRVDVADLDDEEAHDWDGDIGRRSYGQPTARWTMIHREVSPELGLLLDGGRTIRGRREHFVVTIDPTRPAKLIVRSGGARQYPFHEQLPRPARLEITSTATVTTELPVPTGSLIEIEVDLPHGVDPELAVDVRANEPYRVFHWFVLQPD